jgi:hypothetical protein
MTSNYSETLNQKTLIIYKYVRACDYIQWPWPILRYYPRIFVEPPDCESTETLIMQGERLIHSFNLGVFWVRNKKEIQLHRLMQQHEVASAVTELRIALGRSGWRLPYCMC